MINKIVHSLLRVDEQVGYYDKILVVIDEYNTQELKLDSFQKQLRESVSTAIRAINQVNDSILTKKISRLAKIRVSTFKAFRDGVKAALNCTIADWDEKASVLEKMIRAHGWNFYIKGNKSQSIIFNSLIAKFDLSENSAIINELGLDRYYKAMVDAHSDYCCAVLHRLDVKESKEKFDYKRVYREMCEDGADLINAIEAFYKYSKSEVYVEIACKINIITVDYMTTARTRKTKGINRKIKRLELYNME